MEEDILRDAAVLGAAGKMGSGIALILLQEMAQKDLGCAKGVFSGGYSLTLIDSNEATLKGLKLTLKGHMRRFAEQNINALRDHFKNNESLISNEQVVEAFITGAIDLIRLESDILAAKNRTVVFEAIVESSDVKAQVFSAIDQASVKKPYYFSNTSSIPIGLLNQKSGIFGRIIGFHFYNPPQVQRLMEIIPAENTFTEVLEAAKEIAARLGKIVVISKDVAGFIGNGHFVREIDFAGKLVKELEKSYSQVEALWIVNSVTQDFLIRPMGIFQLLDYVGLDVADKIFGIMESNLRLGLDRELIDTLLNQGIAGGQNLDGTQKNGIFEYEEGKIKNIWNGRAYVPPPLGLLEELPEGHLPWKALHKSQEKNTLLDAYFKKLFSKETLGASLAKEFLVHSRDIARMLAKERVANSVEDVNTVLLNGFYHLYGADNAWIPEEAKVRR